MSDLHGNGDPRIKIAIVLAWLFAAYGSLGLAYVAYVAAVAGEPYFDGLPDKADWISRNAGIAFAALSAGVVIGLLAIIARNTAKR